MHLTQLPLELLRIIAGYLLAADLACLALCNHHLMYCFNQDVFFHDDTNENGTSNNLRNLTRSEFLARLSRDLPLHYLCHICQRFHLWRKIRPPNFGYKLPGTEPSRQKRNRCPRTVLLHQHYLFGDQIYRLDFVHVHLVMRQFFYGTQFGMPIESLFHVEVRTHDRGDISKAYWDGPWSPKMTTLMSVDARICSRPPSLCFRIQMLALIKRNDLSDMALIGRASRFMEVCKHIKSPTPLASHFHYDEATKKWSHQQGNCTQCRTSWKLERVDMEKEDMCLILTRWIDLGSCMSPEDNLWKVHHPRQIYFSLKKSEMVENTRARFEDNDPSLLSEAALCQRNVSLLQWKGYRIIMTKVGDGKWFLAGKEASLGRKQANRHRIATRSAEIFSLF